MVHTFSDDLIHWTHRELLAEMPLPETVADPGSDNSVLYPTLLDPRWYVTRLAIRPTRQDSAAARGVVARSGLRCLVGDRSPEVYGQRVAASANRMGGNRPISGGAATSDKGPPAVIYNPAANQYLTVRQDQRTWATRRWEPCGLRVAGRGTGAESPR